MKTNKNLTAAQTSRIELGDFTLKSVDVKAKGGIIAVKWTANYYQIEPTNDNVGFGGGIENQSKEMAAGGCDKIVKAIEALKEFILVSSKFGNLTEQEILDHTKITKIVFSGIDNDLITIQSVQCGDKIVSPKATAEQMTSDDEKQDRLEKAIFALIYACYERCILGILSAPPQAALEISGSMSF